ncbi:hypothetical protein BIY24_04890 [Halobacteriovorax marinus]|uniref:hypothetical protein n=1 Tax=Halobacteriovorax marinus TaxID=97084 RepID=UPI000BC2FABF|nr:hypothetical protein [Halobacteriovorax marinus]ATH07295.1 hypothetical protein BIY24_04890 [Halobacteriovorax marinus]
MKRNLYKILFISSLIIIVASIIYFRNVVKPTNLREHYNEIATENREKVSERRIEIEKEEELYPKKVTAKPIFDKQVSELNFKLNKLEEQVQVREAYCLKSLNETIQNENYIDIKDSMYEDLDDVRSKFSTVLNEAMFRPEADELFAEVYKAVESDPKIDPRLLFARLERIDICRDPKALNFIDSVLEAYRLRKWPTIVRDQLVSEVFTLVKETVPKNRSVENLLYFTNVLLIMADNGLVPLSFSTELEDLSRRLNENHSMFKEVFGPRQGREANYISLSDYLRRNEELGIELRQISRDIENNLTLGY